MTTDLQELFDRTGRSAPASPLDPARLIARARRTRTRQRVLVGAGALAGIGVVAIGGPVLLRGTPPGDLGAAAAVTSTPPGSPSMAPSTVPSATLIPTATPIPRNARVSYCVGVSPEHKAGSRVLVTFVRGRTQLDGVELSVPMRFDIGLTPGPFSVVVDGRTQMSGSAHVGFQDAGSVGSRCPDAALLP